jgi:simple sugar transport system permease protein
MDFVVSTLTLTVRFAVTLMIASMGEMFNQKAGIFNLGCEGIMSVGAFLGMLIPFTMVGAGTAPGYINILGLAVATVVGLLMGLLFGVIVITFRAPQGIAGIGMQMFGVGLAGTFFRSFIGGTQSIT